MVKTSKKLWLKIITEVFTILLDDYTSARKLILDPRFNSMILHSYMN